MAAALLAAGMGSARAQTSWIVASGYPESNFLTQNLRMFAADVDIQAWDNTKNFTNVGAILSKNALLINARAFASVPKELQDAVTEAGTAYTKRSWEMSKKSHEDQVAVLVQHGMQISEAPPAVVATMKAVGAEMAKEWKASASP